MKPKKYFILFTLFLIISSCGSKKVCGGPGGKRCVEVMSKTNMKNIS
jgi:hypothetical protein